ncbi:hypothetical protein ACQYAD_17135 [Neobacillus sp. SM06]|uniref:hypothetical protein n=1 Tax=Neobacillus sp. SM06 TaxID=3422492 RepID=UPI003D29E7FC
METLQGSGVSFFLCLGRPEGEVSSLEGGLWEKGEVHGKGVDRSQWYNIFYNEEDWEYR